LDDLDLIVGLEFLERYGPNPFQFVQWTFGAKARSPMIKSVIDTCLDYIINDEYRDNVIQRTGPGVFVTGIVKYILEHSNSKHSQIFQNEPPFVKHIPYPEIVDDMEKLNKNGQVFALNDTNVTYNVCILPKRALGIHWNSRNKHSPRAQQLIHHVFDGSWKKKTLLEYLGSLFKTQ